MRRSAREPRKRNPAWTQDELILALELYFLEPGARGDDTHPAIQRLSEELNALPIHPQPSRSKLFRNANGVALKLANFKRFDSAYITRGRRGLSHGSEREALVWRVFAADLSGLTRVATAIRAATHAVMSSLGDTTDVECEEAMEGQILVRAHTTRERSRKLIEEKRRLAIKQHGRIRCEVCGFSFDAFYGALGENFIECHHTIPLSEYQGSSVTRLTDLALLCANCHRMAHRGRPWLTVTALRLLVGEYSTRC